LARLPAVDRSRSSELPNSECRAVSTGNLSARANRAPCSSG
jgi:hypothetical protein